MNTPESTDSSGRGADPHRRESYEPQPGFGPYDPGAYESGPGAYAGATDLLDFPPLPPYSDSDTPYADAAPYPETQYSEGGAYAEGSAYSEDTASEDTAYSDTPYPDVPYPDVPFAETQYQEPEPEPEPAPGPESAPGNGGLRVAADAEATARLLIKLPSAPPQPSTTLRPHAAWEDRGGDGPLPDGLVGSARSAAPATPFAQVAASPARPSALPSELAALTTATLVVPLPRDSRPTQALVTTTLPPDKAAQANAAELADAFHDTLEQVFGLDLDSVSAADVGLETPARHAIGADEPDLDASLPGDWFRDDTGSQLTVRPDSLADFSGTGSTSPGFANAAAHALNEAEIDAVDLARVEIIDGELTDVDQAPYEYVPGVVTTASFGGRYGVPTRPAAFPGFGTHDPYAHDPSRHALALRYLGGIFHDSTGESSYLDPDSYAVSPPHESTSALALAPSSEPDAPTEQLRRIPAQVSAAAHPDARTDAKTDTRPNARSATRTHARTDAHDTEHRRGRNRLLTVVVVLAAAFAILYGLALVFVSGVFGGNVPRGTVVDGVSIGGMNPTAAQSAITAGLGARARRPVPLLVGQTPTTIDPATAGLSLDATATVQAAQRDRTNPLVIIPALFGRQHQVSPVAAVNPGTLTRVFTTIAGSYNSPIIEGSITFNHAVPVVTAPKVGRGFSVAGAVEAVRSGYLTVDGPIRIPVQTLQPKASPEALQTALEQIARPAVAAPITLLTGSAKTQLTPTQIGDALTISPDNSGRMVAHVDGTRLRGDLGANALAQEQGAVNASFTINNDEPVLVPARDGRGFSPDALSVALSSVLTQPAPRTVTVSVGDLPAAFTTADAQALGVTDVLGSSGNMPVAEAPNRFANVARATTLIAGNIVQPGATWSFLKTVGTPTTTNGFATTAAAEHAGVDPSGGVDTVATAVFDAAFASGMGDTLHHPHASYIDRYPVGLDAAVVAPGTDLQWTNTGDHPVYLYASYANDALTVALLGEKQYDQVNVQVSQRTAIVQPSSSSGSGAGCGQGAVAGFQVDVTRTLMRGGSQVGTEQFHVTYQPQNGEHCTSSGTSSPGTAVGSGPTKSPVTGGSPTGGGSGSGGHSRGGSTPPPSPSPSPSGLLGGLIH